MKVLCIGVDVLTTYKNKKTGQIDPSVILHLITKTDNGFKTLQKPCFLSLSSDVWTKLLSTADC